MPRKNRRVLSLLFFGSLCVSAQGPGEKDPGTAWKKIEFLLGNWTGVSDEKNAQLGAGQGDFSFVPQLNQKIIVRRNHAAYDSGARHDDLMIIYLDGPDDTPRAIYFDSEGHVIHYRLAFPSANTALFESEAGQPGPRYRLSYGLDDHGVLKGKFEIGPPGADYTTYLSWNSRKH